MKSLLLIFAKNPDLGKVKTRLAKSIGEQKALKIYQILLKHTLEIASSVNAEKKVLFSHRLEKHPIIEKHKFEQAIQIGKDLGERMSNAVKIGFEKGYQKIVIIGADLFDLQTTDIEKAFENLESYETCIGPTEDGGYYLLGLSFWEKSLFENKDWGTDQVLVQTLKDLSSKSVLLLDEKNDIDTVDDLKKSPKLEALLNNL
ncbi:MAG: glycosyltransferase [Flavobacteriaceae bacterium]|nr:glycosyltransferase [Flavobacteriaceae bacterium]